MRVKKLTFRDTLYAIAGGSGLTRVSMLKTRWRNCKYEKSFHQTSKSHEHIDHYNLQTVQKKCTQTNMNKGYRYGHRF